MAAEAPLLDLLVVGGMTIDHLSDGSSVAGGSVIHIARAAAARGLRIGVVTASGPEPEAQAGLAELRGLASLVEAKTNQQTTSFRHRESPDGRRLWLDHLGGSVELDSTAPDRFRTLAALYAPVADELPLDALGHGAHWWYRGMILQGWLRSLDQAAEVRALPLRVLPPQVVDALSQFNVLVASREDLLAESDAPHDQLTALRRALGPRPTLIVTDGPEGIWLDMWRGSHRSRRHFAAPWRVEAVSTVGAGDILAAFLTAVARDTPQSIDRWAQRAMRVVAEVLEERKAKQIRENEA